MTITVLSDDGVATLTADARDEDLWVEPRELERALGWAMRPEGVCRGAVCVPIPPGRRAELVRPDGAINVAALARHRGQIVVHDDARDVWVFGGVPDVRITTTARTPIAPDFTLPDLDGRLHSLADFRGRKVLLNSWASW